MYTILCFVVFGCVEKHIPETSPVSQYEELFDNHPTYKIILSIIFGCSKENINRDFEDIPVVEGYLYAGKPLEIKVSRQVFYSNNVASSSDNLDSLFVSIFDGNMYYDLIPMGDGTFTNSNIKLSELETFELQLDYNNLPISTQTTIPKKPSNFVSSVSEVYVSGGNFTGNDPQELELSWDNPDGSNYFLLIENMDYSYKIYDNREVSSNNQFDLMPTQSDYYSIDTRRFLYFGSHRIILFHINPDLAVLYQETDQTSQNISNPPTEFENAFGIFTGINSDTLFINVKSN